MKKYIAITKDSVINQNDKVKRINPYEDKEYYVVGWDESIKRYRLRGVNDSLEVVLLASSDELIENFHIEVDID